MSSGRRQRNEKQNTVDGKPTIDDSTAYLRDYYNDYYIDSENYIRSQWFQKATSGNTNEIKRLLQLGANIGWENSEKMTILHLAAKGGNKEAIDFLIMLGGAIEARDMYSKTALHWAAEYGHTDVVNLLMKHGAAVDGIDKNSEIVLHWNAGLWHNDMVDLPVDYDAAIDDTTEKSDTALHLAAGNGHKDIIELLIEHGAAVDATNLKLETALHWAAQKGRKDVVEQLIGHGAVIDARNENLDTALHFAAGNGYTEVVNLLIQHGAAVDATTKNLATALHWAAEEGHKEVVNLLAEHGATVDARNEASDTALHLAARNGHKDIVELLIQHGAAVDANNLKSETALHWAAQNGLKDVVNLLIGHGAVIDARNENLDTALHWAAGRGHNEVVGLLIENGAAVDAKEMYSNTALHWAAQKGRKDVVEMLIGYGAVVDARNENLDTALHWAAARGHTEVVDLLIKYGAAVNARTEALDIPLHLAAGNGHKEVVDLLIEHGAVVDATNKKSETALLWAARNGHKDVINFLIDYGAAVDAINVKLETALHWAAAGGYKEVVNLLIEHGAIFDAKNENSDTALHFAAGNGYANVVDVLIKYGAAVDAENKTSDTALHFAAGNGYTEVVDMLIHYGAAVNATTENLATALHWAAGEGHEEVVILLAKHGAAFDARNEGLDTALHLAARNGHRDMVNLLIDHCAPVEATNMNGQTPLMVAVQADKLPVVSLLIKKGAKVDVIDDNFMTSLHWSAKKGQLAILEFLLQNSANIEATTNHGDTALHLATEFNHSIIVTTLIKHHADLEAENGDGNTPIHLALLNGNADIVGQLKLAGARVDKIGKIISDMVYQASLVGQVDRIGEALETYKDEHDRLLYLNKTLHRVVREGQNDAVSTILKCGADIESLNEDGLSPLFLAGPYPKVISTLMHHGAWMYARNIRDKNQSVLHHYTSRGQIEGLILLLNCDSNINIIDKDSKTILHYAAEIGEYEVVAMLLRREVDINSKNVSGETALHCATRCGHYKTIDLLLQRGANIDERNDKGENALYTAVENNMIEIAGLLIDNGIDMDATNYTSGSTALHLAIGAKNSKLLTLLVMRHADINATNRKNETALHIAAKNNLIEECVLLIMYGADIDAKDICSQTPLYHAVESRSSDLVSLLLSYGASVNERDVFGNLMEHTIMIFHGLIRDESKRKFIAVINMLIEAGADTTGIEEMPELQRRLSILREAESKSSNPHFDKKLAVLRTPAKKEYAHRENLNNVDFTLAECVSKSTAKSEGGLDDTRKLSSTKHRYGSGFPPFKRLQLDMYSDADVKDFDSNTSGTAPFAQSSRSFGTISFDDRGVAIIRSLLDCVGVSFFISEQFFMLESKQCVGMIPPKWASRFDKMNGIIRQPGLLIVQIPPKVTSFSIPTWYGSTNPYLRFVDAVYVCRRSRSRLSQEMFADVLGGSEQELATNLHAALIAGLSILSIAGGDGLVEKLVMAICEVKMDPIQNMLRHNNTYDDWQIRNRVRCSCDPESNHRPLSPIAAAKSVGMNIWRERHSYTVNRVWDLKQDKLVNNINVKRVVFITHRWRKDEVRYQELIKSTKYQCQKISKMSKKLYRIHKTLHKHARYVWLDTICIDKSNLSELDEVIRSMYKWYASCTAVVLDSGTTLEKWCSRGWCLQEGAAAGILCGISKDGRLATIQQLAKEQNQKLCDLDLHLCYRPGNAAEILARMDVRHVTREEDRAYALAGIFSIDLPLAYGEGLRARTKLLQQLAIQKGDLSFLSFNSSGSVLCPYLPSIDEPNFLIAKCAKSSTPITVSHIGMCFEVQLVEGEGVKLELEKLNRWTKMNFAQDRFLGASELVTVGEQSENQTSLSVELAIVHDIRSLILVHVYGQDMQTGGGKPIKVCYRLQCCQIEELEFKRLFPKVDTNLERIWLADKPDGSELD